MNKHPGKGFGAVWLSGFLLLTACQPITQAGASLAVSLPSASPTALEHGFGGEPQALPRASQSRAERANPVSPLPRETPSVFSSALPVPTATPTQLSGSASGGGSAVGSGTNFVTPAPVPTPLFYIADILESETGKSILNVREQAWQPDYFSAKPLRLTIEGNFSLSFPLQESQMRFTYEPGLLHQTLTGPEPSQRIVLNGVRPLEILEINPERIQLELPTQYLTDLQVSGPHTLSVESGEQRLSVNVQVKGADTSLAPQIEQVKVHFDNAQPTTLQLIGTHFMLDPLKNQIIVDGESLSCSATQIYQNGRAETFVDIRHLQAFDPQQTHLLQFRTPLGQTLYFFQGQ